MAKNARAAALDLLAYRRAYAPVLDDQEGPYGLAYAWGRGLKPTTDAEVTVCTPDTLADALAAILDDTSRPCPIATSIRSAAGGRSRSAALCDVTLGGIALATRPLRAHGMSREEARATRDPALPAPAAVSRARLGRRAHRGDSL